MKVCFISLTAYSYFNPEINVKLGGAERQLYLLSQELNSDMTVSFVVGDYGQSSFEIRDEVQLFAAYRPDPTAGIFDRVLQVHKLYKAMKRADADVYVFRGHPRKAAITYLLTRLLNRPWVYNLANDPNIKEQPAQLAFPLRRLFSQAITDANHIIAQTPYQKQQLAECFGVDASIVPNGYPPADPPLSYEERSGFLWVGRFDEEQKRPHRYLDLAEALPEEQFVLIGGEDNDASYYEQITTRAQSLSNVEYIGRVPPNEIHEYYREAIALINTSAYEGFPNTFLEAWRQGTPVLSLDIDPSKFIDISSSGYCEGSSHKLIDLASKLVVDRAAWKGYAKPARRYFEKNLTIDVTSRLYRNALVSTPTDHS